MGALNRATSIGPGAIGRFLTAAVLALVASAPLGAQSVSQLLREPELERGEARRLIAPRELTQELTLDHITVPPRAERKRQAGLRRIMRPVTEPEAILRVRALEQLIDYDEEDQILYGPGRTQVFYGRYFLEADKVVLDARLREIQAEGDVILKIEEDVINAESMRFNFDQGEGVAFDVSGEHFPVFFHDAAKKGDLPEGTPQLQRVSEHESLFRQTDVTTCNFSVPHFHVKGREVILYEQDRIFIRGATFQVWSVPIFYLPVYSRSLTEGSPWFVQLGFGSRSGFRIRAGYEYKHRTEEPSFEDDEQLVTRSEGTARVYADYLSKRGPGLGLDYDYMVDFNKHRGDFSIYGFKDSDREVASPRLRSSRPLDIGEQIDDDDDLEEENDRWRFKWRHRTDITDDLYLILNIDEFSDPDIFRDVLDFFSEDFEERERQVTRRSRVALTYLREAYVVRIMAELKDRIGIDRFTDFSDPRDDDRDFDLQPDSRLDDVEAEGISNDRFGRVSSRLPQINFATRWLPLGRNPIYHMSEFYIYNNLDKGLNVVDNDDDTYVQGIELYQGLLRQWKISPRYTLLTQVGLGFGGVDREDDLGGTPNPSDGLEFVDDNGTFLIGNDERNFRDVNNAYIWGDAKVQLNARFSDALRGDLLWRIRETTDDFLGDFYAAMGNLTARDDLFNYKIREHWIEGGLNYRLVRPLIRVYARAGYNLTSRGDVYSKEPLAFARTGFSWSNQRQTLVINPFVGWEQQQKFDPSDDRSFEDQEIDVGLRMSYSPIHGRWYFVVDARHRIDLEERAQLRRDEKLTFFEEEDTATDARLTLGRELGPKWNTEFRVRWDDDVGGLREVTWILERDLHDAVAVLRVSAENDDEDTDDRDERSADATEIDIRLGLRFKLPDRNVAFGADEIQTLKSGTRRAALAF